MQTLRGVRRLGPALAALAAMLMAACGQTESPLQVGIQRAAVDLAFQDEDIDIPEPEVQRIVQEAQQVSMGPEITVVDSGGDFDMPDIEPPLQMCPSADPDAVITDAVTSNFAGPPEEGVYTYVTQGSVSIQIAELPPISLPIFGTSEREVRNVQDAMTGSATQRALGTDEEDGRESTTYEVHLATALSETVYTYHLIHSGDARGIHMEKWERTTGSDEEQRTIKFEPGPAASTQAGTTFPQRRSGTDNETGVANIYQAQSPGHAWRVDSVDVDTQMSYLLDHGRITAREQVDMCGELIDTYRSETTEQISRISADPDEADYVMQTHEWDDDATFHPLMQGRDEFEDGEPNARHFATHWGPVPIIEEYNFTEVVTTEVQGQQVPVFLMWKYTATLMDQESDPLPDEE